MSNFSFAVIEHTDMSTILTITDGPNRRQQTYGKILIGCLLILTAKQPSKQKVTELATLLEISRVSMHTSYIMSRFPVDYSYRS